MRSSGIRNEDMNEAGLHSAFHNPHSAIVKTPTDGSGGRLQSVRGGFNSQRRLLGNAECGMRNEDESTYLSSFRIPHSAFRIPHYLRAARFSPISLSSAFCGSANLASPSLISVSSIFAMSTFASISASTSAGGSFVDLLGERQAAACDGVVRGRRVRLDVAAGERRDVLSARGRVRLRLLRAGAGEDHLLLAGSPLSAQNSWFSFQMRLAFTMPTCPWAAGERSGRASRCTRPPG